MQKSVAAKSHKLDWLLWALVVLIVAGIVVGNIVFAKYALSLRVAVIIVMSLVALFFAYLTSKGQFIWTFLKESRLEMRKVVWPNRQETTRTTLLVIAIVVVMALVLWGVDSLFALVVSNIVM